ncbi:hypothetical protein MYCTH_2298743 [Thermothelomyces thermophilus ATCC 42464]|uniref:Uncharacterized protein n=1 Tax=Thermothelomyces thermophilus (strain ATCC 42464 / BCRC 31852 / DSM 1799) TaxID=573729 RepID=G2Q318_THET4|nr:uncharacterized protein MYCTH_2298743 [Thermothelomyces thermophilus ATCC 42464]AEO55185.1 hypothetical protein MYCTH_2298743 [Thermothelomyces thermophilus ATCC 42464]
MADAWKESIASTDSKDPTTQQLPQSEVLAKGPKAAPTTPTSPPVQAEIRDHRLSDEWDASKVPPSRFQKRKGSIYAVPHSRDGRIDSNYPAKYFEKLAEMSSKK